MNTVAMLALSALIAGCSSDEATAQAPTEAATATMRDGTSAKDATTPKAGADEGHTTEADTTGAKDITKTAMPSSTEDIPAPADVAAPPADASKTSTGLAYKVIQAGSGEEHPTAEAKVQVHYTGWTTDGKMFDSSVTRGKPAEFPLNRVIAGWTEGLQLMVQGEKTRFWIPEALAYQGRPGAPAGMLVFEVELLQFTNPPAAPADVAAAPKDAKKTASGLAYKVLAPGTGTTHPSATSKVTVHYSGWTTDGKMFDSSVVRGQPASFPLDRVIAGWTEGLQLMVEGEKTRFWIPVDLAYQNRPGKPAGTLVFDVELLGIK